MRQFVLEKGLAGEILSSGPRELHPQHRVTGGGFSPALGRAIHILVEVPWHNSVLSL